MHYKNLKLVEVQLPEITSSAQLRDFCTNTIKDRLLPAPQMFVFTQEPLGDLLLNAVREFCTRDAFRTQDLSGYTLMLKSRQNLSVPVRNLLRGIGCNHIALVNSYPRGRRAYLHGSVVHFNGAPIAVNRTLYDRINLTGFELESLASGVDCYVGEDNVLRFRRT